MLKLTYGKLEKEIENYPFPMDKQLGVSQVEEMYSYYKSMSNGSTLETIVLVLMLMTLVMLITIFIYNKKTKTVLGLGKFQYTPRNLTVTYTFIAVCYLSLYTKGLIVVGAMLGAIISLWFLYTVGIYKHGRKWFKRYNGNTMSVVVTTVILAVGVYLDLVTTNFIKGYEEKRTEMVELLEEKGKVVTGINQLDIDQTLSDWSYVGSIALTNGEIIRGVIDVAYSEKVTEPKVEYETSYEYSDLKVARKPIVLVLPTGDKLYDYMEKRYKGQGEKE